MKNLLWYITAASALCSVSSLSERRYHFIYEPKNWTEAQSYCRENYTDLVTVDNLDVITTLNNMVDRNKLSPFTYAWIGLYRDVTIWNWLSDRDIYQTEHPNFSNWDSGQPDTLWYGAGCGALYSTGKWHDAYCEQLLWSVCSNVTGQNAKFIFINTAMTWKDARSYCREHFTELAIPRNMSENDQIRAVIPAGHFCWAGFYRDSWKWSDGTMYVYRPWVSGQPNGGSDKCASAFFDYSGHWGDWPCDLRQPFICHHDPVPFTKQVVKVKLVGNSAVDLNDPAVLEKLQEKLQQKLQETNSSAEVKLSWKKRLDGTTFYKEKKEEELK
ncbi:macrophage mannose receptor 1-like [Cyprinodon tularosa]|uniref:macrophage mannose receptor 1-like n=1 Tax=Cyprinodon tularosa TaxID=77115 RepID=UPI0018E224BA|nr:macrophage mannose receptor 1-like [Cyprinodon tularosa]XP_038154311.1 macrophage mannose receptor 1-like [Cyprinodon tularosa]